jgi:hypothetical protein
MFILSHLKLPSQTTGWESLTCNLLNDVVSTAEMSYRGLSWYSVQSGRK